MIWTDNMIIPKGGDAYTASVYMNYAYIPAVAAKIAAYIQYVTPVKGTQEAMSKVDPSLAGNQLIFPSRRDARQGAPDRPGRAQEPELQRAVAGRARRLTRT